MQPLVSVCIPAYNNSATIANTIQSILGQTYQNIEVIIADDKSSDNTVEIVEAIAAENERVKLYRNEQNLGMVGNWNHCLALCKGEFIKLICADDMIEPTAIEEEARAMQEHPTVNLVESDTRLVDINGKTTGAFKRYHKNGLVDGKKVARASLLLKNFFGAPVNNLMRRSALEKIGGFDSEFTYILDFDMWIRLACSGDIYIIHKLLNSFCIRHDSNTGVLLGEKQDVYVGEHRRLVEKHAQTVHFSEFQCYLSIWIRKMRNVVIGIYLKLFAK